MCLVAWSIAPRESAARFSFVLASNRDEFFGRAAAPLAWWQSTVHSPWLLGGRDLVGGGSWLALRRDGHLALVTNVRQPGPLDASAASRGELVSSWLAAPRFDTGALQALAAVPRNGFNLLVTHLAAGEAAWVGNRPQATRALGPGLWGLSNAALDTPWPKVRHLKARLAQALAAAERSGDAGDLMRRSFEALADATPAPDDELPTTGVPPARERQLSSAFIRIGEPADYGTRCSTVIVAERRGERVAVQVCERRFGRDGQIEGESLEVFDLSRPPHG
jgi:uncharacterized protein with NRDE domain